MALSCERHTMICLKIEHGYCGDRSDYRTYGPIAERCARRLLVTQQSDPFSGEALVTSVTRRTRPMISSCTEIGRAEIPRVKYTSPPNKFLRNASFSSAIGNVIGRVGLMACNVDHSQRSGTLADGSGRPSARSRACPLTVRGARYSGASDGALGTRRARGLDADGSATLTNVSGISELGGAERIT
jgi:hypothetical protein